MAPNTVLKNLNYISQIDYSYWRLAEISKHKGKPESPLSAMIDKATGFDVAQVKQQIKEVKYLASVIIRCKEKLGYDASRDREFLIAVKKL